MKKRLLCLLLTFIFCITAMPAQAAGIAMQRLPVDAMDMRLGQCMIPKGYSLSATVTNCSDGQSILSPLKLNVVATSPDQRSFFSYESTSTFVEIVSSTLGGRTARTHQDGAFDEVTMTWELRYMTPAAFCQSYAQTILPGIPLTYLGDRDLSGYTPLLQQLAQQKYKELTSVRVQGASVDGFALTIGESLFSYTRNGTEYAVVISTLLRATQMTFSSPMIYGGTKIDTCIVWDALYTYAMICPAAQAETLYPAYQLFMQNTTTSDQFNSTNQKLADSLRTIVVAGRGGISGGAAYSAQTLRRETGGEDTYDDERFTDYLFDQNDYTLSDGSHVKISTEYSYVYEGDNGTVYYSDSAFGHPGGSTQLYPNR